MKKLIGSFKTTTIIVVAILSTMNVFAQFPMQGIPNGEHKHSGGSYEETLMNNPPHGGMIQKAGKYYIEMVVNMLQKEDKIILYLINGKGKVIPNEKLSGNITFIADDGTTDTQPITARGEEFFVAQILGSGPLRCIVTFNVKNKKFSARFDHRGLVSPVKEQGKTYICSMHPDIQSNTPGRCSKCGMDLKMKKHKH